MLFDEDNADILRLRSEIDDLNEVVHRAKVAIREKWDEIARIQWAEFPIGCVVRNGREKDPAKAILEYVVFNYGSCSVICRRRVANGEFGSRTYDIYYPEKLRDAE